MKNETFDIKQFIFPYLDSNMYVIVENNEALVIDPHYSEDAEVYLKSQKVKKIIIFLTHEHFDHTSGINWFKNHFEVTLVCHRAAMDEKSQKYSNRPTVVSMKLLDEGKTEEAEKVNRMFPSYTYHADIVFDEEKIIKWNDYSVKIVHSPGHSPASCLIFLDNHIVFTGDSLIPNIATIVRWPGSNPSDYRNITLKLLLDIPSNIMIYPGHGTPIKKSDILYQDGKFVTI